MQRFIDLMRECLAEVPELMPWDLAEWRDAGRDMLLLDVREPHEFAAMHMPGSINVPRGIVESACEYDYEETVPELVESRQRDVVVICRSGYRSLLAASALYHLGFERVFSLKTGVRGWNEFEQPLQNGAGEPVDIDDADEYFTVRLRPEQMAPQHRTRGNG